MSVAKELTKPGWSSRLQSWEAGTRPALPWSYVALYNEGFVSIPTLLGNQSHTSLFSCSLFLPLWPGEGGKGRHLYLDGAGSLLGGQRQPFIRDRGGSGISPAGMRPCRLESLWEGRRYPGPRESPPQDPSPEVLGAPCALSQVLPPLLSPREEVSCQGICCHANCLAWSPAGLSPGGHWNGRWKGNP